MGCSFKVVWGPLGPRLKIVDRGVLHRNKIAHKNKHVTILLYSVLLRITQKILAGRLTIKVLQTFEAVRGPRGPRISILGLMLMTVCESIWRSLGHCELIWPVSGESTSPLKAGLGLASPAWTRESQLTALGSTTVHAFTFLLVYFEHLNAL